MLYLQFKYPKKCGPYKIDKIRDLTADLSIDFKNGGALSKPVSVFFMLLYFI